jgi:Domain of unknown function (DUF1707)
MAACRLSTSVGSDADEGVCTVDTATSDYKPDDLRVSDADRDRALSELSEHYQAGRLLIEEFDERSGQALRARTGSDLARLFADLPRSQATGSQATGSQATGSQATGSQATGSPALSDAGVTCRSSRCHMSIGRICLIACAIAVVVAALSSIGSGRPNVGAFVPALIVLLLVTRWTRGGRRREGSQPKP